MFSELLQRGLLLPLLAWELISRVGFIPSGTEQGLESHYIVPYFKKNSALVASACLAFNSVPHVWYVAHTVHVNER